MGMGVKIKVVDKCAKVCLKRPLDEVLEMLADKRGDIYYLNLPVSIKLLYLASTYMEMRGMAEAEAAEARWRVFRKYLENEPKLMYIVYALAEDAVEEVSGAPLSPIKGEELSVEAMVCIPSDVAEFEVEGKEAETIWLGKADSVEIGLDELIKRVTWAAILRVGDLEFLKKLRGKLKEIPEPVQHDIEV